MKKKLSPRECNTIRAIRKINKDLDWISFRAKYGKARISVIDDRVFLEPYPHKMKIEPLEIMKKDFNKLVDWYNGVKI